MDTPFKSIITSQTGICLNVQNSSSKYAWGIVRVLQSHVVWFFWALGKQEVAGKGARGLDRFAQPCVFHFTSLKRSLLCYETSWKELKRIPGHGGLSFMGGGAGGKERQRAADIISRSSFLQRVCSGPHLRAAVPKSFECQLSAHKHSARAQRASPRRLSHFNSCVIAGDQPNCCCLGQRDEKARTSGTPWKIKQRRWWQGRH